MCMWVCVKWEWKYISFSHSIILLVVGAENDRKAKLSLIAKWNRRKLACMIFLTPYLEDNIQLFSSSYGWLDQKLLSRFSSHSVHWSCTMKKKRGKKKKVFFFSFVGVTRPTEEDVDEYDQERRRRRKRAAGKLSAVDQQQKGADVHWTASFFFLSMCCCCWPLYFNGNSTLEVYMFSTKDLICTIKIVIVIWAYGLFAS